MWQNVKNEPNNISISINCQQNICTVQTLNMVIWYKLRLDISYKMLWSRIFSGFYNVKDKKLDIRSTWYKGQHLTVPSRPLYRVCTVFSYFLVILSTFRPFFSYPSQAWAIISWGSDQTVIDYVPRACSKKNLEGIPPIIIVLGQIFLDFGHL